MQLALAIFRLSVRAKDLQYGEELPSSGLLLKNNCSDWARSSLQTGRGRQSLKFYSGKVFTNARMGTGALYTTLYESLVMVVTELLFI